MPFMEFNKTAEIIFNPIVEKLRETTGVWLGILEDIKSVLIVNTGEFSLEPVDTLLLYTDGVIELSNKEREYYDLKRLKKFLLKNGPLPSKKIASHLINELNDYMELQLDDITYMVIKKK